MTQNDAAQVARRLSKAQRDTLVNGVGMRSRFATVMALVERGLLVRRICHPDSNGFPVTAFGLEVRALLLKDHPNV